MGRMTITEAYAVLGINEGAHETVVKSAYRKLALKTHPDKNKDDPEASQKFHKVSEAYKRITDPESFRDEDDDEDGMGMDEEEVMAMFMEMMGGMMGGRGGGGCDIMEMMMMDAMMGGGMSGGYMGSDDYDSDEDVFEDDEEGMDPEEMMAMMMMMGGGIPPGMEAMMGGGIPPGKEGMRFFNEDSSRSSQDRSVGARRVVDMYNMDDYSDDEEEEARLFEIMMRQAATENRSNSSRDAKSSCSASSSKGKRTKTHVHASPEVKNPIKKGVELISSDDESDWEDEDESDGRFYKGYRNPFVVEEPASSSGYRSGSKTKIGAKSGGSGMDEAAVFEAMLAAAMMELPPTSNPTSSSSKSNSRKSKVHKKRTKK